MLPTMAHMYGSRNAVVTKFKQKGCIMLSNSGIKLLVGFPAFSRIDVLVICPEHREYLC